MRELQVDWSPPPGDTKRPGGQKGESAGQGPSDGQRNIRICFCKLNFRG